MACRGQAGDVDDVLDANRNAMQWSADSTRGEFFLGRSSSVHRSIGVEPDEGVQLRIKLIDPRKERRQQLDR